MILMNSVSASSMQFLLQSQAPSAVLSFLQYLTDEKVISDSDFQLACFIEQQLRSQNLPELVSQTTVLIAAAVSDAVGHQHTCLNLATFTTQQPFMRFNSVKHLACPIKFDIINLVDSVVLNEQLDGASPLVLFQGKVFFRRYFGYEQNIANYVAKQLCELPSYLNEDNKGKVAQTVESYFDHTDEPDHQKSAVYNSINHRFSIITGGPGTGKTTTVAKLLLVMAQLKQGLALNIQLVAPTGKAAQRLTESLHQAFNRLNVPTSLLQHLPVKASTIHRLLKNTGSGRFRHHKQNPLGADVVIVDEASMVDVSLMSKLIDAMPMHSQLVLLGDVEQLPSVEAGSVLQQLCLNNNKAISRLTKSYRFDDGKDIGKLAKAIISGHDKQALALLENPNSKQLQLNSANQNQYNRLIERIYQHQLRLKELVNTLTVSNETTVVKQTFALFSQLQVLTCVNDGEVGVEGINQNVTKRMLSGTPVKASHFELRPIMITENAYPLNLYNGDIGIQLVDPESDMLMTYFMVDNQIIKVHNQRLPKHQTVYAMTVHKSQGSEFTDVIMVLPIDNASLNNVDKAILYTGLTRAKEHFELLANRESLLKVLNQTSQRNSALGDLITFQ